MRLGEGTGAVLAMGLAEAALRILREMATFEAAGVTGLPRRDGRRGIGRRPQHPGLRGCCSTSSSASIQLLCIRFSGSRPARLRGCSVLGARPPAGGNSSLFGSRPDGAFVTTALHRRGRFGHARWTADVPIAGLRGGDVPSQGVVRPAGAGGRRRARPPGRGGRRPARRPVKRLRLRRAAATPASSTERRSWRPRSSRWRRTPRTASSPRSSITRLFGVPGAVAYQAISTLDAADPATAASTRPTGQDGGPSGRCGELHSVATHGGPAVAGRLVDGKGRRERLADSPPRRGEHAESEPRPADGSHGWPSRRCDWRRRAALRGRRRQSADAGGGVREAWRVVVVGAWLMAGICAAGIVGVHFLLDALLTFRQRRRTDPCFPAPAFMASLHTIRTLDRASSTRGVVAKMGGNQRWPATVTRGGLPGSRSTCPIAAPPLNLARRDHKSKVYRVSVLGRPEITRLLRRPSSYTSPPPLPPRLSFRSPRSGQAAPFRAAATEDGSNGSHGKIG